MMKKTSLLLIVACLTLASLAAVAQDQEQPSQITIHVRDYCDPATFNAALGPVCNRSTTNGAITVTGFFTELSMDKSVGAWRFAPSQTRAAEGAMINLQNLGGETHTFTRVKRFGGGFVAPLNAAAGTPEPAPECAKMVNGQLVPQPPSIDNIFIPAGGSATATLKSSETVRYQCCIHPWMHMTITPQDEHHDDVH
jgi:plastocyanin